MNIFMQDKTITVTKLKNLLLRENNKIKIINERNKQNLDIFNVDRIRLENSELDGRLYMIDKIIELINSLD